MSIAKCPEYGSIRSDDNKDEPESLEEHPNDIFRKENFAIAAAYFSVGLVNAMMITPINVYLVKVINAEPHQQNTIGILQSLPWCWKILFGFLSDTCPIGGMHRKPYLTMGTLVYSIASIFYSLQGTDNIVILAICLFLATIGLIQLDGMVDTMCVERSRYEPDEMKGQMQTNGYTIRFIGSVIGALLGALLCNKDNWGWGLTFKQLNFWNGLFPFICIAPWLVCLKENYDDHLFAKELKQKEGNVRGKGNDKNGLHSMDENGSSLMQASSCLCPACQQVEFISTPPLNKSGEYEEEVECLGGGGIAGEVDPHKVTVEMQSLLSPGSRREIAVGTVLLSSAATSPRRHHLCHRRRILSSIAQQSSSCNEEEEALQLEMEFDSLSLASTQPPVSEEVVSPTKSMRSINQALTDIWDTMQLQSVWRPMAFVYLYNILQVPNVAWQSFLQLSLHFEPWILGLTSALGCLMTLVGVLAYKHLFFKASLRSVYICSALLAATFSLLQLILVFQLNTKYLHLSNYMFSLGDDVVSGYFIAGIQFLPVCIMYMRLCPDGSEGASYAMLSTFGNIAQLCANNIGNHLSTIWDVSNSAMRRHDVSGLWKLTVLTSCLAATPLLFLVLLPTDVAAQEHLSRSKHRSQVGGAVFLIVLLTSFAWIITTCVLSLVSSFSAF